jgi:hypothetical protein
VGPQGATGNSGSTGLLGPTGQTGESRLFRCWNLACFVQYLLCLRLRYRSLFKFVDYIVQEVMYR